MSSLVTVYISSYNYEKYLPECLDSVVTQSHENIEILIYDDCSTDHSVEIIEDYADKDSRIIFTKGEVNKGPNCGTNWALQKARGDFFAILNSDDKFKPKYWETLLPYFENPEIGFVSVACLMFNDKIGEAIFRPYNLISRTDILEGNRVFASSPFRMKMQKEIGLFDNNADYFSDWDFWIRCVLSNWKWAVVNEPMFYRRIHSKTVTSVTNANTVNRNNQYDYMLNKWGPTLDKLNVKVSTLNIRLT